MRVYKLFFQLLRKQIRYVLVYLLVFFGLAYIMINQAKDTGENLFERISYPITIFDEDHTELSKGLVEFLSEQNEVVEIEDEEEVIQDELYARYIAGVVRIPSGFESAFLQGQSNKMPELTTIPGTIYGESIKGNINQYCSVARGYLAGGISREELAEKTKATCQLNVEASLYGKKEENTDEARKEEVMYYSFLYLPYIFISICIVGVGSILIVFNQKEVRERNMSSSYPMLRTNLELYAGVVTAGLVFCVCFILLVTVGLQVGFKLFESNGLLYCLNMLCFTAVALGITFLIGQVVKKEEALNMAANVIGLGMCFLCGIFVPLELLGESVKTAAHFLPAYWYVVVENQIHQYEPGTAIPTEVWTGLGIQLLFGIALVSAGIMWNRMRVTNSVSLMRDETHPKTSR